MSDEPEEPESGADEAKPPKIKAEDNPWYLLATLYGVPGEDDYPLRDRNRVAWNKYVAASLPEKARARIIEEKQFLVNELNPLPGELLDIERAYAGRVEEAFIGREVQALHIALPAQREWIDFSNVEFDRDAFFEGYVFAKCSFRRASFTGKANFFNATFVEAAVFSGSTFSALTQFNSVMFYEKAVFWATKFVGPPTFRHSSFGGNAKFSNAFFSEGEFTVDGLSGACFANTIFAASSDFVNATINGTTSFEEATFAKEPPQFFGAKLHQGTIWRYVHWPKPEDAIEAGRFIDAYACLKLEMDRLKKHEDELNFFALELQSRHVLQESAIKGSGLPVALYGLVSDYGRSYARPLYALFAVAAVGTLVLLLSGVLKPWQSLGLSLANTLNVFGFRKDFLDPQLFENLPVTLKILAALQTILGTILLFLFGLGIRNKFRMK